MKAKTLIAMLLTTCVSQTARSQSAAPAPQKQDAVQQYSADEQRVKEAGRAVRRAAAQAAPEGEQQVLIAPPMARHTEKAAYLGLSTSPPPPALRHQLKLPDGTALVVDFVQPNSPAQKSGIRQYDLLLKLNDQLLINAEQLAVLVRTFKPGEEVHLTLLREGEKQSVPVALAERDLPPLNELELQLEIPYRQPGSPPAVPRGMPGAGGGGMGGGAMFGGGGAAPGYPKGLVTPNEHTLTWLDGKRQITVSLGDDKTVTVTDAKTGKIMFHGPLEAVEQQRDLSPDTRDALKRLKQFLQPYSDKKDNPDPTEKGR